MGFFSSLFGGGGPKAYQDPNLGEEQNAAISGIRNQLGAKKRTNPAYSQAMQQYNQQLASYNQAANNPALGGRANSQGGARQYLQAPQMPTNIPQYTYDYSDVNKPIYGSFGSTSQPRAATGAGRLAQSTRGAADTLRGKGKTQSDIYNVGQQSYDFSPINQALKSYQNPQDQTETYTSGYRPTKYDPYQFNFKGLPEQYFQTAYQQGAKDINRKGQENLTALAEKAGVRRPGMLFKAGEQAQRATGEQLAALRNPLLLEQMQQSNQNAIEQQRAQASENQFAGQFGEGQAQFGAGEGYKGFQSRSDLEKANIDNRFRNAQALESGGQNRIVTQSNVLQQERDQQNTNLQYLLSLLQNSAGAQNQAAQIGGQKRGQTLDFLGKAAGAAAMFCLPRHTRVETEDGSMTISDIHVGDKVKGGTVIAISRKARPEGHVFTEHVFKTGKVIMTDGHPYFDELIEKNPSEQDSDATYDILTDSGYYYVNGVKLGSTIKG